MGRMLSSKPYGSAVASRPTSQVVLPGRPAPPPPKVPPAKPSKPTWAPPTQSSEAYLDRPVRKVAFYFGLAAIFVRLGVLPEIIKYVTGVDTYLLYLTALPAIVGCVFCGAFQRTFRKRAAVLWLLFFVWVALAIPLSFWPGGSARLVVNYLRTNMLFLVIAGGLAVRWSEIRAIFYTVAAAAVVNLITARYFVDDSNGRISLTASGTIGNSNDLAAHLLLVMPFLLFISLDPKRNKILRALPLIAIADCIYVILGTASRGALVALFVVLVFAMWRASQIQRLMVLVGGAILVLGSVALLPSLTLSRLGNLFGEKHYEAEVSEDIRSYLFKLSLTYTATHPIFGVGPGQFSNFEGSVRKAEGEHGVWRDTHCTLTQVSAENGVPALIFFVLGLGAAFVSVLRLQRKARQKGDIEIANACFCYLMGAMGFLVAITFLSQAYYFSLPMLVGLAGALCIAGERRLGLPQPAVASMHSLKSIS